MVDVRIFVLFKSISVILGGQKNDIERMCSMVPRLPLKRFSRPAPLHSGVRAEMACLNKEYLCICAV